jgi:hypothetical protein
MKCLRRSARTLAFAGWLFAGVAALAQSRPYIGFAYPAGGRQGTTFQVTVGGQGLDNLHRVYVSGAGVKARVLEYHRRLSPQDVNVLRDQLAEIRKAAGSGKGRSKVVLSPELAALKARVEERLANYVNRPACASIANLAIIEVTLAANAPPGERELRLGTPTGLSNPLSFHVGQLAEVSREPMKTCEVQVLGKEELALRKGGDAHQEVALKLPCTVNGQLGSGELHRYRFSARQGQQIVIATLARQLIPYIADAVPGWVQPVLRVLDAGGRELAYADDFRFKPDPVILFSVPADGEYVFTINDNIYRGREDFVYRITAGELPYLTSVYPLGAQSGQTVALQLKGANLAGATVDLPPRNASPGIHGLEGLAGNLALNRLPFAMDDWPDLSESESGQEAATATVVKLPAILNGRIERRDDWDVFRFTGRAGETVVAEVMARRLDSPLDSIVKITDAAGRVLAFNDDREDPGAGVNTHHADSYIAFQVPADGDYFVHVGDTGRSGGGEHAYRLRLGAPRPDFGVRLVPSSLSIRGKSSASIAVHVARKDGFAGPIQVTLRNPPSGVSCTPVTLSPTQEVARLAVACAWTPPREPVSLNLEVVGIARIAGRDVARVAVGAEDRMQAFLWRHLVPTAEFRAEVYNSSYKPARRQAPPLPVSVLANVRAESARSRDQSKFTKGQVAGRLRMLASLYEEGLLTNDFYWRMVAECETAR